jgi:phenylacetic acid degradation operon negative regulatory protein
MDSKTEELLFALLWTCDVFSRPTWRSLTESFEGWAYRNGFSRQLQRLEKNRMLERQTGRVGDRLHRLTRSGCLCALGGRDPEACWNRHWDGRWRLVLFDVPRTRNTARDKLRRYLRGKGFGCLQNSVWITPDLVNEERDLLRGVSADVGSLVWFEGRPCAGEKDAEIVAGAWDFAAINQLYVIHQQILDRLPHRRLETKAAAMDFHRWLGEERKAWMDAMSEDPLLPKRLLPDPYLGRKAWRRRLVVMTEAGELMRRFQDG